jgi:hypothetical protein
LHHSEQALDGSAGQNPGAAEQDAKSTLAKGAPFVVVFISEIIIGWALYGILLHVNMFSVRAGIISAALCWFGFVLATVSAGSELF